MNSVTVGLENLMRGKSQKKTSPQRLEDSYGNVLRGFLKELLKNKIKTLSDREDLAEQMGVSIHYVNSMLYRNEGGFDAWTAALAIAYGLKPHDLKDFFSVLKGSLKKAAPLTKSDEVMARLDSILNENERYYWLSMLHALIVADKEIRKK